jgi:hypothetical protein
MQKILSQRGKIKATEVIICCFVRLFEPYSAIIFINLVLKQTLKNVLNAKYARVLRRKIFSFVLKFQNLPKKTSFLVVLSLNRLSKSSGSLTLTSG